MDRDSRLLIRKIVLDVVTLAAVSFPILLFFIFGKPYHRGFFCNDESLLHPFKDSTVSNVMLYIVGLCLPIAVIILTEYVLYCKSPGHVSKVIFGRTVAPWIWSAYIVVGVFGFGAACSQLTTDIAKYTIGRLRPHFFDVCRPNINCSLPENQFRYIEDFTCTANEGTRKLKDVRLSFPSGHSSFSAYTMLFVAMYLQSRMTWRGSKLLKHGIQFLCIMLSWATAMSRISNYKHHWSDVLCGLVLGWACCIINVLYVSDLFQSRWKTPEEFPLNPNSCSQSRNMLSEPGVHNTHCGDGPAAHPSPQIQLNIRPTTTNNGSSSPEHLPLSPKHSSKLAADE